MGGDGPAQDEGVRPHALHLPWLGLRQPVSGSARVCFAFETVTRRSIGASATPELQVWLLV